MNVNIGTAPDSWGVWFPNDPKQTPWNRFLDEAQAAGYEWTELGPYGYLPTDVPTLRGELERHNLKTSGSFAMAALEDPAAWPELERQVNGAGELINTLGGKFLVLIDDTYTDLFTGRSLASATLDDSAWNRLIDTANRMATHVHDQFALQLVFHNHAETHVEYEDQIERFLAQTDPAQVALCFDIGHFAYRGGDPVAFMRKHYPRIPYLHLKSVDPVLRARVNAEKIPFATAVGMDLFCEPAQGVVDFPAFRDLLREIDYTGCGIVEQDMYPAPFDKPFPIAKRTRAYLREIGIG